MLDKWDKFSKLREMFAKGYDNAQRIKKEIFPTNPIWSIWMSDKWKTSWNNKKEIIIDYIKPLEKNNWLTNNNLKNKINKFYEV